MLPDSEGGIKILESVQDTAYDAVFAVQLSFHFAGHSSNQCCTQNVGFWQLRRISPIRWAPRRVGGGGCLPQEPQTGPAEGGLHSVSVASTAAAPQWPAVGRGLVHRNRVSQKDCPKDTETRGMWKGKPQEQAALDDDAFECNARATRGDAIPTQAVVRGLSWLSLSCYDLADSWL